jgi:hypothetical protein
MDKQKLVDDVNRSGFPLQIGIANHIQDTQREHGWIVGYKEHAWRNAADEAEGFLDLGIRNRHGTSTLVLECKRVLDASWVFLIDDEKQLKRRQTKAWVNHFDGVGDRLSYSGWLDLAGEPESPKSDFCVVSSTKEGRTSQTIEPMSAHLLSSTEAVAIEDAPIQLKTKHSLSMYFSAIVTTATINVCFVKPDEISLKDGKFALDHAKVEEHPYVRFHKQLSTREAVVADDGKGDPFDAMARAKERSVFVVNALHLAKFLKEFEVDNGALQRALRA